MGHIIFYKKGCYIDEKYSPILILLSKMGMLSRYFKVESGLGYDDGPVYEDFTTS